MNTYIGDVSDEAAEAMAEHYPLFVPRFDGPSLLPADHARLDRQQTTCERFMSDGLPHTIEEVAAACGCSQQGASARIRDLRKPRFGGHEVERQRVADGLFTYQLVSPSPEPSNV